MPVEFRSGAWRVLARYRGYPYFSLTLRHLKTEATSAIAPRTRRAYAPATLERYRQGWDNFFRHHPKGQLAPPLTLTTAALDAFRKARVGVDHISVASVNRDLTAIQSLLRWLRHKRPNAISRPPRVDKFLEHDYSKDARHLEPAQWAALSTVPTARYAKFMPHDQHRRDQVARISAAYAQKMPAVEWFPQRLPKPSHQSVA